MLEFDIEPAELEAGRASATTLRVRNGCASWYANLSFDVVSEGGVAIVGGDAVVRNLNVPPNSQKPLSLSFFSGRPGTGKLYIANLSYRCDGVSRRESVNREIKLTFVAPEKEREKPVRPPREMPYEQARRREMTGPQLRLIVGALTEALTIEELRRLVSFTLESDYDDVVSPDSKRVDAVFQVVKFAKRRDALSRLIADARAFNRTSPELAGLIDRMGAGPVRSADNLEAVLKNSTRFQDPAAFRGQMSRIEAWICRIDYPGGGGTGFLVGPDLVITNHHVMKPVFDNAVAPGDVRFRFDFKNLESGKELLGGTTEALSAGAWRIDDSPPSAADLGVAGARVAPDELDYALVRLGRRIGDEKIQGLGPPRGWLTVPSQPTGVAAPAPILILQYPGDLRLQLAIGTVLSHEQNGLRVRHTARTIAGSSGSPCFDANWGLFAIHHSTDPDSSSGREAAYNEATPISAIVALMAAREITPFWDQVPP